MIVCKTKMIGHLIVTNYSNKIIGNSARYSSLNEFRQFLMAASKNTQVCLIEETDNGVIRLIKWIKNCTDALEIGRHKYEI